MLQWNCGVVDDDDDKVRKEMISNSSMSNVMLMMAMGKTTAKVLQQMLCLGWELESFRGGV